MSAMATAILGGPLTVSFLALETTGSLPQTIAVLVASVISSVTARHLFGDPFATWRFHLRAGPIRSAADIGLMAVERVREGEAGSAVIRSYEFSRTTIYEWLSAARRPGPVCGRCRRGRRLDDRGA